MNIRKAGQADFSVLSEHDKHISPAELMHKIEAGQVYIAEVNGYFAGWLRYGLFWDNIPMMNSLNVVKDYQRQGIGRALVHCWEVKMKSLGCKLILTSTLASEQAQHFYRALGYQDCGALLLPGEPLEIFLIKTL